MTPLEKSLRTAMLISSVTCSDLNKLRFTSRFRRLIFHFKTNVYVFRLTGSIIVIVLITYIPYLVQWQIDILVHRDVSQLSHIHIALSWFGRWDPHTLSIIPSTIIKLIIISPRSENNSESVKFNFVLPYDKRIQKVLVICGGWNRK